MAMEGRDDLTAREREVLELIKRRWRNKEIARHFVIEESTVETHVHNALGKLGCRTRQELWNDLKLG